MKNYLHTLSPEHTPQREALPGRTDQVPNHAGGHVFEVSDETRLLRFLILGTEGGTFYASERSQTKLETGFVVRFVREHGLRVVEMILDVVRHNRAPKADPALVALAAVAKLGDLDARKAAWSALPQVARTGTHLFHFLAFLQTFGGWGRLTRAGVAGLYLGLPVEKLALWAVKYKARDGWTHADALRLAHPKTDEADRNAVFRFMVDGVLAEGEATEGALQLLQGHLLALRATSDADAAALMREYRLPIEAVPTPVRGPEVYRMALETNGLTWTLRNLGNLARTGLLVPGNWDVIEQVVARISSEQALRRGRVHPIDVLKALLVYRAGRGVRGSGEWPVVPQVVDALDQAFSLAFGAVRPAGRRFVLGLDVSGSMDAGMIAGVPGLTPRLGTAAMSLVTTRTEPRTTSLAFSASTTGFGGRWGGGEPGLTPLTFSARTRLDDAVKAMSDVPMGGTDCALPMLWAARHKVEADVFVVYTDNETWAGPVHPAVALQEYRQKMGLAARLIVVGMTATRFTIADPKDAGMLDLVGFDSSAPQVMAEFAAGHF
ncbi:RNA-binding protein Rsr [Deinococcus hohokamensis]|uniref:RNA-binding protein Rsr n=1 Tax=Deinococcus hohokamensis TaxID=309883 RepID=A0ABV9IBL2_9DEIO